MKKFMSFLKKEILELIPPFIYFFVVFHILFLAKSIIQEEYGIKSPNYIQATIAALIVGKSILLANALPILNLFRDKRLIYNIIWRTILYLAFVLFIKYLEDLIPLLSNDNTFMQNTSAVLKEMASPKSIVIDIILVLFLFIYVVSYELVKSIGKKKFKALFFGKAKPLAHEQ
jgi:hypothetical protein